MNELKNYQGEVNLKEKAYNYIKEKISLCEIEEGEPLNEKKLIEEIGVSRTPIREAIQLLMQENLVRIVPYRGVYVTEITLKEANSIFQIREALEPYIVKIVTPLISEELLIKYETIFKGIQKNDSVGFANTDDSFHRMMYQMSDNSYIIRMMDNVRLQNQRIRFHITKHATDATQFVHEHLEIISFMKQGEADKAAEVMKIHVLAAKERAISQLIQNYLT